MTSTSTEATASTTVFDINKGKAEVPERQGREMAKTGSLKRRDASWDKKWQEHIEKNIAEDNLPRSSVFTRSPRLPGKVNRSMWENRVVQEAAEANKNVPRPVTPRRNFTPTNKGGPGTKPHYGASLIDYSPSRTATPPYPSERVSSPDETQGDGSSALPPPPPPIVADFNHNSQVPSNHPVSPMKSVNRQLVEETTSSFSADSEIRDDWKKEVCEICGSHRRSNFALILVA